MQLRKLLTGFIVGAAALLGAMGATVANATPATVAAPAVVGTTSVTLPLMGAPLTIDITTGPGGALTDVSVNPADGLTATTVKPNRVSFVNTDGTAKVSVKSKGNGQSVSARAGSLADISGDGSWSGDVFGTGTNTDVAFNVSAAADGSPVIAVTSVSDPTAVVGDLQSSTHDDDMSARISIAFTSAAGDQTRSLTIRAKVDDESGESSDDHDGGDSHASISVSLGRLHGVAQDAATAAGPKSWTGLLCDGVTMGVINYTLNADGTITDVAATPTPESIKGHDHSVEVRFSHDERITITAKVRDGMITVNVREGIRCRNAADPTVNTPVSTVPDHHDGDHHGDHHDGDHHDGDHHKGGGHSGHGGH